MYCFYSLAVAQAWPTFMLIYTQTSSPPMNNKSIMRAALVIVITIVIFIRAAVRYRRQLQGRNLPPGPSLWQLLGRAMPQLGGFSPHKFLALLAEEHGPVMTIPLGAMTTVVISSADAAREMFKMHDAALSDRMLYESMKLSYGNEGSIVTADMGPTWRTLRRLWASHFFTTARLDASRGVWRQCVDSLVRAIEETGRHGTCPANMRRLLFLMSFNHFGRLVFSRDLIELNSEEGCKFYDHAQKIMRLAGKPNLADYVPVLRRWDPQGIRTKMDFHVGIGLDIVAAFVEEKKRREDGDHSMNGKDFLDVLLEFSREGEEPAHNQLPLQSITNMILELFMSGTDTTANTLEWAMAELLRNPTVMSKVQAELRQNIDAANLEQMEDKDFANLPYLNAVIKETLRLHPSLPLLVPRKANESCTMLGYHIPKGTQILVNVWKMGRDSEFWCDPTSFRPERFLKEASLFDFKGQHFEFIPFGAGRRICPGVPLISRMLPMVLGTLLFSFDWILPNGLSPESMDMSEDRGIILQKAMPLSVIATPRKRN